MALRLQRHQCGHQRSDSPFRFVLDPRTNLSQHLKSTFLNHDCHEMGAFTFQSVDQYAGDQNDDGQIGTDDDANLLCDRDLVRAGRDQYALKFPDAIVVYVRGYRKVLEWVLGEDSTGHWHVKEEANNGAGGAAGYHIEFNPHEDPVAPESSKRLAHEGGHYLHLGHNHPEAKPATMKALQEYLQKRWTLFEDPALIVDGDRSNPDADVLFDFRGGVYDTPPDPGQPFWENQFGERFCDPANDHVDGVVWPDFPSLPNNEFHLAPDRENMMSYFGGCLGSTFDYQLHFSHDQVFRMFQAVFSGNRYALANKDVTDCAYALGIDNDLSGLQVREKLAFRLNVLAECLVLRGEPNLYEPSGKSATASSTDATSSADVLASAAAASARVPPHVMRRVLQTKILAMLLGAGQVDLEGRHVFQEPRVRPPLPPTEERR
jgi:hypothetical protein